MVWGPACSERRLECRLISTDPETWSATRWWNDRRWAKFVGMENQIGTLEQNKLADIILLSGNPTQNIYELLTTKVVFKEGRLVIDNRPDTAPAAPATPARGGRGR